MSWRKNRENKVSYRREFFGVHRNSRATIGTAVFVVFLLVVGNPVFAGRPLWEVDNFTSGNYFGEADYHVDSSDPCPGEMGWEGHTIYFIFDVASGQILTGPI